MLWFLVPVLAVGAVAAVVACSPARVLNITVPTDHLRIDRGIAYGEHQRQQLDIYAPRAAAGPLPVLVFFFGGAWQSGSRDLYTFLGEALASRGYLVVIPDYRVVPQVEFPVFIHDGARAVRWVVDHAGAYGGDARRLAILGHSAGAHIAAMLALRPDYLSEVGLAPDIIRGMVGLAGPYDFLPITGADIRRVFAAAEPIEESQPITFVRSGVPPMLLLTGDDDTTVLPRNSRNLARALREAGSVAEVKTYPGLGHIGIISAFASWFRGRAPVLEDTVSFLDRVTAPSVPLSGAALTDAP